MQGMVKGALVHVREDMCSRVRQLGEEALGLRERVDASHHTLSQRAEDAAALATQARTFSPPLTAESPKAKQSQACIASLLISWRAVHQQLGSMQPA